MSADPRFANTILPPQIEPTPSTIGTEEANELFLELMGHIQKIQTPGDEIINPTFTFHKDDLSPLVELLESFDRTRAIDFSHLKMPKIPEDVRIQLVASFASTFVFEEPTKAPKPYSEQELKEILGEKYYSFLKKTTKSESLRQNAFMHGDIHPDTQIFEGHVTIGSEVIQPDPHSAQAQFFLGLTEKEKFQFTAAHEVGHFIQHCKTLQNNQSIEDFENKNFNFTGSTQPTGIVQALEEVLSFSSNKALSMDKPSPTLFFGAPESIWEKHHRQLGTLLKQTAREIYADSFALLMAQQWNETTTPFNELFQSVLNSRKNNLYPVFEEISIILPASLRSEQESKNEPSLAIGNITYNIDYALSYLGERLLRENIEPQALQLDQIHTLCQDTIVYGLTQVLYEASLVQPQYGQFLEDISSSSTQIELFEEKPLSASERLFSLLSLQDKINTQQRVADYSALKKEKSSTEAYRQAAGATQFIGPGRANLVQENTLPNPQLSLMDKISQSRRTYSLTRLNSEANLEVPKPIAFKPT